MVHTDTMEYYADLKKTNVDILTGMESFPQPNVLLEKIEVRAQHVQHDVYVHRLSGGNHQTLSSSFL